jgi:alkylation response protein AidB-like acyl-CoA dehydrogenase
MSAIIDHRRDLPAFRHAIRTWLAQALPPREWIDRMERAAGVDHAFYERCQREWLATLNEVGLAIPHWPQAYGGAGLDIEHLVVLTDEMARAGAPRPYMYMVSLTHMPTTLLAWGTEEQKKRYLPGIARGEVWCQGFSEPGSGSDLASLRTSARRDGDDYVINGQKVWSSFAMYAQYCILLARTATGERKHDGISYFIMDMKAPGVEVRPIRQSTGRAEFSELFLTDVRIPASHRVGPEGRGWEVAQTTLAAERGLIVFDEAERLRYRMDGFLARAVSERLPWWQDAEQRRCFMRLAARLQGVRGMVRALLESASGRASTSPVAPSVIKVAFSRLKQQWCDFESRVIGLDSLLDPAPGDAAAGPAMHDYLDSFGGTIAGGANEIQLNIISERGLGMPR